MRSCHNSKKLKFATSNAVLSERIYTTRKKCSAAHKNIKCMNNRLLSLKLRLKAAKQYGKTVNNKSVCCNLRMRITTLHHVRLMFVHYVNKQARRMELWHYLLGDHDTTLESFEEGTDDLQSSRQDGSDLL